MTSYLLAGLEIGREGGIEVAERDGAAAGVAVEECRQSGHFLGAGKVQPGLVGFKVFLGRVIRGVGQVVKTQQEG